MPKGKALDLSELLDEYYSKKFLSEIPHFVTRTRVLKPLDNASTVPRQVHVYLEQAGNSFVIGLWDSAIALARACVEEVLKDRVGQYVRRQKRDLVGWITEAETKRLLSSIQLRRARRIQHLGNVVLHERSASEEEATDVISRLREFVAELYR